jgi:hypothetical protein
MVLSFEAFLFIWEAFRLSMPILACPYLPLPIIVSKPSTSFTMALP